MAKLSRDEVLKLAKLAHLQLSEKQIVRFQEEIGAILEYVQQLQHVDVSNLKPTAQVSGMESVTRPDVEKDYGISREALLRNLPASEDGFIKVRRMLQ